jgi:DNA sulfur modification protein DndD
MDVEIPLYSRSNNLPLTVIEGAMGTGKTNLLNALTWCLYGKEEHLSIRDKGLPIINNIVLSEMMGLQSDTVEVKLTVEYEDGKTEIFQRRQDVTKPKGDNPLLFGRTELKVFIKDKKDRDWHVSEDPEFRVDRVLPHDIQEYFLFDGERLDKYFAGEHRRGLKKEVFEVSQLDLFEKVIDHLEKMNGSYQKELENINPKVDEIKQKLDRRKLELQREKEEREKLERKLKEAKALEEQLLDEVKKLPISGEKIEELKGQKEKFERRLKSLEDEIAKLNQEKLFYLIDYSKLITTYQCMKNTKEMISTKVEKGEIPPEFKKGFIEKILEKGICICGTDVTEGQHKQAVQRLLEQCNELDEISQELIREDHNLLILLEKARRFKVGLERISKDIVNRERDYELTSNRLKEIETQIFGIDDEKVKNAERRYKATKIEIESIADAIGMKKQSIKDLTNLISDLEKAYYTEVKKIEKHDSIKCKLEFSRDCINVSKDIMVDVMEEIRKAIEERAKDQFLKTIWKKETYKDVRIDEDYNISVLDQNGMEAIGTLSAGERQFLALSFVNALHMVSGFKTPIVIDTPLGRISGVPKLNLARELSSFLEGKQLVLLVTDQEYNPEVRAAMRKSVGQEYRIRFIETENGSKAEVLSYEEKT